MNNVIYTFSKRIFATSCFFLVLLCCSCSDTSIKTYTKNIHPSLARNQEVIKSIQHYQEKGAAKKLEALLFLLKNMESHYALYNILNQKYDSILSPKEYGYQMPADQSKHGIALKKLILMEKRYGKIKPKLTKIRYDVDLVTSEYLIENIDLAFKVWQEAPWISNLSFTDFCKNVLPYRADQEPMHRWRPTAFENFKWVLEKENSRLKACSAINDSLKNVLSNMIEMNMYPTRLTYDRMYKFKLGICEDETAFTVMAMRSVGLPVGIDFVAQWPQRSMGHSWNYLLLEDGTTVPFMGTESNPGIPHFEKEKKGKVYRKTFSKQPNSLAVIEKNQTTIPAFFRTPYIKDVTNLYAKTHTITIPLENNSLASEKYVYLSVFDNQKWVPIAWAFKKGDQATFSNLEGGIVYLPKYYQNGRFVYGENPFFLNEKGTVIPLIPSENDTQKLTLTRKYPLAKRMDNYLKNIIGGRFEVSNTADFSEVKIIKALKEKPTVYKTTLKNNLQEKYKYLRYRASESDSGRCNLAILNAYSLKKGKRIRLKGKIIGTQGSYKGYGAEKHQAFDNNPATFFDAPEKDWGTAWIGMAFENPVQIESIDFMPRNDTNTIFKGQQYELFFWDKGWQGLGKKTATNATEIQFKKVPENALYLLHNYTEGKEERIFTWEDGQVVWH